MRTFQKLLINIVKKIKQLSKNLKRSNGQNSKRVIFVTVFAIIGAILLLVSRAASPFSSLEPEGGAHNNVALISDLSASGGAAIQFGGTSCSPLEAAGCTQANSDGVFFRESFNGGTTSPTYVVNNIDRWYAFPFLARHGLPMTPMEAQHGQDCAPPPAFHNISTLDKTIFMCKDHLMTAIDCCGRGLDAMVTLQPNHLVDLSKGEAVVRVDVSTRSKSASGDWWEIWLTPWDDQLVNPMGTNTFHQGGPPRNSVMLIVQDFDTTSTSKGWGEAVFDQNGDEVLDHMRHLATGISDFVPFSDTRRDTYEIRITKEKIKKFIKSDGQMKFVSEFAIPGGFKANEAVVQFAQSNYRTRQDGGGCSEDCGTLPNTWHWDNVEIYPAIPYKLVNAQEMYLTQTERFNSLPKKVTFKAAAPANARLIFRGWDMQNKPKISFDNGANWQVVNYVRPSPDTIGYNPPGIPDALSYSVAIPAGQTSVLMNGNGSCYEDPAYNTSNSIECEDPESRWGFDGFMIVAR
jgi:hypothetical protein